MELTDDDLPPADPLALIAHERAAAQQRLTPDPRLILWPWGVAWLVGFALFFLSQGPGGRVYVALPGWLPLITLIGLLIAAGVLTAVVGVRAGRHVTGSSSRRGAMYGIAWSVAFLGMSTALARVGGLLPDDAAGLLWAGVMVGLTGALHMAGGAVWDDRSLFLLGAFVSAANVAGLIAGPGWHSLVMAVAGGGGMLVAGFVGWLRWRR